MESNSSSTEGWDSSTVSVPASHTDPPVPVDDQSLVFILVPIFAIIFVISLTVGVLLLLQRKRRLDILRHQLVPFYNFAPGDEEDWETELVENDTGHQCVRRDYNTMAT